jgi:hypothetical protein
LKSLADLRIWNNVVSRLKETPSAFTLFLEKSLDHELETVLLCRWAHIDKESNLEFPYTSAGSIGPRRERSKNVDVGLGRHR